MSPETIRRPGSGRRRTLSRVTIRVAVTTSADRASGMSAELVAAGLQPIVLPCVELRTSPPSVLARARAAAEEADLLILASARPLDLLWPSGPLPATPVAAVRASTASKVAERGGKVVAVGEGERPLEFAESLVEHVTGLSVAFPHASSTDPRAIVTIADAAAACATICVYSVAAAAPGPDVVEAVVFQSPASVHGWAMTRSFDAHVVACNGRATRSALTDHARDPDVFVPDHDYSSLASALAARF